MERNVNICGGGKVIVFVHNPNKIKHQQYFLSVNKEIQFHDTTVCVPVDDKSKSFHSKLLLLVTVRDEHRDEPAGQL